MNLTIGKKIALGFATALAALLIIGYVSQRNLVVLHDSSVWVNHTLEVERELESLKSSLIQAESSSRAYRLMPENSQKENFNAARVRALSSFRKLRSLTEDNKEQQDRMDLLDPKLNARLESLERFMEWTFQNNATNAELVKNQWAQEALQVVPEISKILKEMGDDEKGLLQERRDIEAATTERTSATIIYGTLLAVVVVMILGLIITQSITGPVRILSEGAAKIGGGDYSHRVAVHSQDEVGNLANLFNTMAAQVQERQAVLADQDWLKSSLAQFATLFQGQRNVGKLSQVVLSELATILDARHSVLYVVPRGETDLKLEASYAFDCPKASLKPGEGLSGQALTDKKRLILTPVPDDYLKINSALGSARPHSLIVQPLLFEGEVKGVMELASFKEPSSLQLIFLERLAESLGLVLNTISAMQRTEELLGQSQKLTAELGQKNTDLETQTNRLRASEMALQEQQEELKQTNEELEQTNEEMEQINEEMEEKVKLLAEQKDQMGKINAEIEEARETLEQRTLQAVQASGYKSEFLANMSHELRTPLNSLLILSKMLADNTDRNLSEKQVQYAETIHSSGNDLLELINDVLDLTKIESGMVELERSDVAFEDLGRYVEDNFRQVALKKNLDLRIELDPQLPASILTDGRRLQQILKNLLSNAIKFTEKGSVTLRVFPAPEAAKGKSPQVPYVAFLVKDTGIGIPADKLEQIFEAFKQADAGTSRKYGGTGLGLSISRELSELLTGSLQVTSKEGEGSAFTLYLPTTAQASPTRLKKPDSSKSKTSLPPPDFGPEAPIVEEADHVQDDREKIQEGDLILLIIEDDRSFARIMLDFAREKKFKGIVAHSVGQGIALARRYNPSAITLDLHLPDSDGWIALDRLKHDPKTRHIPVHIISVEEERERSLRLGAVSYFQKPVTKEILDEALTQTIEFIKRPLKNLLIIEDDSVQRQSLVELIGNGDVHSTAVGTAAAAFAELEKEKFDCIVLDLGLPDKPGIQFIREVHQKYGLHSPPIIVYTGKDLSRQEETELRLISDSIVIKNVRSPERLLDETALFLHRVQTKLPESKRRMIEHVQKNDSILAGRKVLVVDDDVRNIFAITSALEASKMEVRYAESGKAALEMLEAHTDIEVILMDVMMPEMDGFEAIRRIRQIPKFRKTPIISVTAKAMRGDRDKCLEAGASDYITKPVDMDQLRSLLRVWLYT